MIPNQGSGQGSSLWKIMKKIILLLLAIGLLALVYANLSLLDKPFM